VREEVEFRLLGTVEASDSGQAVDLGPARQRCVLVALLVDVNHVVPTDQLVDRVWADRRPYRASSTLYSYLSRLRTALSGDANVAISHRSGGYLLTADPDSVDLHRFRRLVTAARSAADRDAAALFERALALWRGEPFAALDTPWLGQTRAVLEAERRAAELDRNDLELRRGRHGELVAALAVRAAEHPLDERLASQLMLAWYRSGRQAEALRVYRSTRTTLVEELGLEPGPELSSLHQRILTADPTLATPAPEDRSAPAPQRPVPRQLPVDVVHFTGRRRYLADLDTLLDESAVVVAIDGTAGVGKTALAVHFGHLVAGRFPDGQLYVDLRGYAPTSPMTTADALGWMLRGLGTPPELVPADGQERAALYRSVLAGRRVLVLLDNARNAAQVRPLLPASPGCMVVVTSRTTLATLDGVHHLHLDVLSEPEALALLARLAGRDRVDREPEAATTLVSLCARLPLAVRIAGARLAARPSWTVAAFADRLADQQHRLDELQVDDRAVRASFAITYHALRTSPDPADQRAARAFRLLGVLDWVEMSVPVAAALLDRPQPEARDALERLLDAHLLDSASPGRYHTHDLLRLYARDAAIHDEPEPERRAALRRALDCYLAAAERATLLVTSDTHSVGPARVRSPHGGFALSGPSDVAGWTDAEHANLLAAATQLARSDDGGRAARFAFSLTRPFEVRGHWSELITLLELVVRATQRNGDLRDEATAREALGYLYLRVTRTDDAIATTRDALARWRQNGDRHGESVCLKYLGYAYFEKEQLDQAIDWFQRSMAICREIGYRYGEAGTLNALGLCRQRLGAFDEAIACHRAAFDINRRIGNRLGESSSLNNLGWAQLRAGHHRQAADCYQEALTLARSIGFRYQEAEILWGLGRYHHALGNHDQARTCWQHAITILQEIHALSAEAADDLRAQPIPDTPEIIRRNT
jgi:DNA-binding SARP family transcriptional activator/Tfp pilus assembly protein PilF